MMQVSGDSNAVLIDRPANPLPVRILAQFFSYLFHPVFIPLYGVAFMIWELKLFPERNAWEQKIIFIQFFVYYTLFPLAITALLRLLKFIDSIHLKTRRDRIIPYVACEIFYFWSWYVFKNLPDFPKEIILFALGIFLAASLGLILNAYMKVSMHALSVGVLLMFVFLAGIMSHVSFGAYLACAVFIAGVTCTSRLIASDHTQREIYTGLFAGIICQFIAYWFV